MLIPTSGQFENGVHRIPFRVYYEDTDAGGIVYHSNYLRFAERARTEALRLCGIEQTGDIVSRQMGFVVGRCTIEYRSPVTLDDVVVVETSLQRLRKVRMTMLQQLTCHGREVARLEVEIVMIGADRRAAPIPDDILAPLLNHMKINEEVSSHDG